MLSPIVILVLASPDVAPSTVSDPASAETPATAAAPAEPAADSPDVPEPPVAEPPVAEPPAAEPPVAAALIAEPLVAAEPLAAAPVAEAPPAKPVITIGGDVRLRAETLDELDFDDAVTKLDSDGQRYWLKTRLKIEAKPHERVAAVIQLRDSRRFGQEPTTAADSANLDLHQGYLTLDRLAGQRWSLKAGRQELSFGDQRLVGGFAWDNVGRAFDGIRSTFQASDAVTVDGWWARLHDNRRLDRALGDDFYGLYGTWKHDKATVDGYAMYLYDRGRLIDTDGDGVGDEERFPGGGRLHLVTVGSRVDAKPAKGVSVNAEVAAQVGDRGDLSVFAFAVHLQAGYTAEHALKPGFFVGGDYSPGDEDGADDTWSTWENLFPTNHLHYGYMDIASWKNIVSGYVGGQLDPAAGWNLNLKIHALARAEKGDTFYRASGVALRPRAAAAAVDSSYVGTEADLVVKYKLNDAMGFLGGLSYLVAGSFLDDTDPAGDAPDAMFGYLQAEAKF